MRNSQPRDYFECKCRDTGDCVKNMSGDPACEFCPIYLECSKCYRYDSTFCDKCTIAVLRQSFDISN